MAAYALSAVDFSTGHTLGTQALDSGPQWDTSQLAGITSPDGVLYQSTVTGIDQIQRTPDTPDTAAAPIGHPDTAGDGHADDDLREVVAGVLGLAVGAKAHLFGGG